METRLAAAREAPLCRVRRGGNHAAKAAGSACRACFSLSCCRADAPKQRFCFGNILYFVATRKVLRTLDLGFLPDKCFPEGMTEALCVVFGLEHLSPRRRLNTHQAQGRQAGGLWAMRRNSAGGTQMSP